MLLLILASSLTSSCWFTHHLKFGILVKKLEVIWLKFTNFFLHFPACQNHNLVAADITVLLLFTYLRSTGTSAGGKYFCQIARRNLHETSKLWGFSECLFLSPSPGLCTIILWWTLLQCCFHKASNPLHQGSFCINTLQWLGSHRLIFSSLHLQCLHFHKKLAFMLQTCPFSYLNDFTFWNYWKEHGC